MMIMQLLQDFHFWLAIGFVLTLILLYLTCKNVIVKILDEKCYNINHEIDRLKQLKQLKEQLKQNKKQIYTNSQKELNEQLMKINKQSEISLQENKKEIDKEVQHFLEYQKKIQDEMLKKNIAKFEAKQIIHILNELKIQMLNEKFTTEQENKLLNQALLKAKTVIDNKIHTHDI